MGASDYGFYTYGPVVDGLFAPGIPGKLLLQGSFDHDLTLMLGHNADEGLVFTSPFVDNDTAYDTFIESTFPGISPSIARYIEEELYPVPANSTLYDNDIGRASLSISESTFVCNTLYLDRVHHHYESGLAIKLMDLTRLSETKHMHTNSVYLRHSTAKISRIPSLMVRIR